MTGRADEEWVTHLEAARRLGVSHTTVQNMLRRGDLVRRPQPRGLHDPSVGAASVEAQRLVLEQRRAERGAARRFPVRVPPDTDRVWLDVTETAAVLQLSTQWVKARARAGRIPATMHGGKWWVRRDHAEVLAAARAVARRS